MLKHRGTQPIETERLLLRRIRLDDAANMYTGWTSDPEVARYCVWSPHGNKGETMQLTKLWVAAYEALDTYRWGICVKGESDRLTGVIDVVEQDKDTETAEIGYALSRAYWHKGIVTEALTAVLAHLFSCGYASITACHDTRNPRSGAVMRKCGMRFEGIHPGDLHDNTGAPRDSAHYRLTRSEYETNSK